MKLDDIIKAERARLNKLLRLEQERADDNLDKEDEYALETIYDNILTELVTMKLLKDYH